MALLIGGSPGTGSSLLRQMLNRHPRIYCGPETNVFAFPVLFDNWKTFGTRISATLPQLKGRLVAPAIRVIHGTRLVGQEQTWTLPELKSLVADCKSFPEFCDRYFEQPCSVYGKEVWAEKTPANVLSFHRFIMTWETGVALHMTRNPLDTIASLVDRGISLFEAASRYLYNCAWALKSRRHPRYVQVDYGKLVMQPAEALGRVLELSGLTFTPEMIKAGNPVMVETSQLTGWRYSETDTPRKGSIGRFAQADEQVQDLIRGAVAYVQINPEYAALKQLDHLDFASVAKELGYPLPESPAQDLRAVREQLLKQEGTYRRSRLLKNNWWYEKRRPIVIADA